MVFDVFSSFDPDGYVLGGRGFLWRVCFFPLLIIFSVFWCRNRPMHYVFTSCALVFIKNQRDTTNRLKLPIKHRMLMILFLILMGLNLIGLVPYVFSVTSHLVYTLRIGFPLWLGLVVSGAVWSPRRYFARLLPGGAPRWLNPFLVLVETIRVRVRPFTLSFRLAANIRAGHIVIFLLRFYIILCFFLSFKWMVVLFLFLCGYIVFEIGIGIVQAYIFCLLLSLYTDDHPVVN